MMAMVVSLYWVNWQKSYYRANRMLLMTLTYSAFGLVTKQVSENFLEMMVLMDAILLEYKKLTV